MMRTDEYVAERQAACRRWAQRQQLDQQIKSQIEELMRISIAQIEQHQQNLRIMRFNTVTYRMNIDSQNESNNQQENEENENQRQEKEKKEKQNNKDLILSILLGVCLIIKHILNEIMYNESQKQESQPVSIIKNSKTEAEEVEIKRLFIMSMMGDLLIYLLSAIQVRVIMQSNRNACKTLSSMFIFTCRVASCMFTLYMINLTQNKWYMNSIWQTLIFALFTESIFAIVIFTLQIIMIVQSYRSSKRDNV